MKKISLFQAVSLALSEGRQAVLNAYGLGSLIFRVYTAGHSRGQLLRVREPVPQRRHFLEVVRSLTSYGTIKPARGLASAYLVGATTEPSPAELICVADPFAYMSHLSAMEIHGVTDRLPHTLFVSSPAARQWQEFAGELMRKDLGERLPAYIEAGFPPLHRPRFDRVQGRPVHVSHSIHLGAFKRLTPGSARVASIGRTFLDMIREPDLCGGIQHVLDTYRQHANKYLMLIVDEIERHGGDIDKVRAGYILEEVCQLEPPVLTEWLRHAKRGGSRRLVARNPYSSTYSAKWCLSLNGD